MNPANRLLNLAHAIRTSHLPTHGRAEDVFYAAMFYGEEANERALMKKLEIAIVQIELTEQLLTDKEVPEDLWLQQMIHLKSLITPSRIHIDGSSLQRGITPEMVTTLQWAAWYLPRTETPIDHEAIQDIKLQIFALEELLVENAYPNSLRFQIRQQIAEMKLAIESYDLAGITPIEKVVENIVGNLTIHKEDMVEAVAQAPENQKQGFKQFAAVVSAICSTVERAAKTTKSAESLASTTKKVIELITG